MLLSKIKASSISGKCESKDGILQETQKDWSVDGWKRVKWSDETKVNKFQSDDKEYFWKRQMGDFNGPC